jgi:predicted HAD superfamily Cof-like phosphohydrolase
LAYPIQQSVAEFHKKFGHPVRDTPQTLSETEAKQAFGFIEEELMELADALWPEGYTSCGELDCCENVYRPNVTEAADALGDIVITAYGNALRMGIDLDLVLAEQMRANMTKTANGMGKIKKTPGIYKAPDVAAVLARQTSPQ